MLSPPKVQAMNRIRAVEDILKEAKGKWSNVGVRLMSYFTDSPREQVLGALGKIDDLGIQPWIKRANKILPTDQENWDRWVKDGNDLLKNIAGIAQDASSASIQDIVAATVKESAKDVGKAAKAAWSFRYWAILGLVSVAAIVFLLKVVK